MMQCIKQTHKNQADISPLLFLNLKNRVFVLLKKYAEL